MSARILSAIWSVSIPPKEELFDLTSHTVPTRYCGQSLNENKSES